MRVSFLVPIGLACVMGAAGASADPTALSNGVFIAHAPSGLQYTNSPATGSWCGAYAQYAAIDSCSEQINHVDTQGAFVWYVLSAWAESKQWCGAQFGLGDYDANNFVIWEHGACFPSGGLTIPTSGWPGPNEGIALTTTSENWSGNFVPIYWFAGYVYGEDVIPLGPDPDSGLAGWARCEDQEEAEAVALGGLGLLTDGVYVCPEGDQDSSGGMVEEETGGAVIASGDEVADPDVPEATVQVLPGTIDSGAGHATFLIREAEGQEVNRVDLAVGPANHEGSISERTTARSSLWEVYYGSVDTTCVAELRVWGRSASRDTLLTTRSLSWQCDPWANEEKGSQGEIRAWFAPGKLGYAAGLRERPLAALSEPDSLVLRSLLEVGATSIEKPRFNLPDTTTVSPVTGKPMSRRLTCRYYVRMNPIHAEYSICRILLELGAVERAEAMSRVSVEQLAPRLSVVRFRRLG
jgi:hypothetical protein